MRQIVHNPISPIVWLVLSWKKLMSPLRSLRFILFLLWIVSPHLTALKLSTLRSSFFRSNSKSNLTWLQGKLMQAVAALTLSSTILTANPHHTLAEVAVSSKSIIQQSSQSLQPSESSIDREIFRLLRRSSLLNDKSLLLPSFNTPTDDFWYPPFLLGRWKTELTFDYAEFQPQLDSVPIERLRQSLPALSHDPSDLGALIFQAGYAGKNIPSSDLILRFVQLDGHPREDHPYNLKHLVTAFTDKQLTIDKAPYSFQKQYNWIYSPANYWNINYHTDIPDQERQEGSIRLETIKRNIFVETGYAETTEFFRQVVQYYHRL